MAEFTMWVIAEHVPYKHERYTCLATYCFDTKAEADDFFRFVATDPTRASAFYMPMPVR